MTTFRSDEIAALIDHAATTRLTNDLQFLDRLTKVLNSAAIVAGIADRFVVSDREGLIVRECGAKHAEEAYAEVAAQILAEEEIG